MIEFNSKLAVVQIGNVNQPKRKPTMSDSEVMTIMVLFQLSNFRHLKGFYTNYVQTHLKAYFPKTVSYNRFFKLQKSVLIPMAVFAKTCSTNECTGISFIDYTPLRVCNNKRIFNHKVFDGIATMK